MTAEVEAGRGKFLTDSHFDRVITSDTDVLKPDGTPLLLFRRNAIPFGVCTLAYPHLRRAAKKSLNRGTAAGGRHKKLKKDGTVSGTNYAKPAESGIIGYMDANSRMPACRTTAYTTRERNRGWPSILPFIRAIDGVFSREMPDRYEAQMAAVRQTPEHLVIPGTAFTTVTVNRNFETAVHRDAGDLASGFGVMSVVSAGSYRGGYFVFPRYRIAVEMTTRDVLLADVHEPHGNSPLYPIGDSFERISTVLYFRSMMTACPR